MPQRPMPRVDSRLQTTPRGYTLATEKRVGPRSCPCTCLMMQMPDDAKGASKSHAQSQTHLSGHRVSVAIRSGQRHRRASLLSRRTNRDRLRPGRLGAGERLPLHRARRLGGVQTTSLSRSARIDSGPDRGQPHGLGSARWGRTNRTDGEEAGQGATLVKGRGRRGQVCRSLLVETATNRTRQCPAPGRVLAAARRKAAPPPLGIRGLPEPLLSLAERAP